MFEPIRTLLEKFKADGVEASERCEQIAASARFLAERLLQNKVADAMFVCTHNSRRSQFAHVWASVCASHFGLDGVRCYSGGTEVTACNERTVASLQRFGFEVEKTGDDANPVYLVRYSDNVAPVECSSKLYTAPGLHDFAAMMCCADVDEKCPLVQGAAIRIAWHYDDPKSADDTDQEAARYDERSLQIGSDMFHVMSEVSRATQ